MEESLGYIHILVNTLEKQKMVLNQILEVTKQQTDIAMKESFDELLFDQTLDKKEILIARLNELDDGFASVYGRVRLEIQDHREKYTNELRQLQNLIRECTDISNELRVLEQRNKERVIAAFASKQREYGARQTAATVASHYQKTMYNTRGQSRYFNQKN